MKNVDLWTKANRQKTSLPQVQQKVRDKIEKNVEGHKFCLIFFTQSWAPFSGPEDFSKGISKNTNSLSYFGSVLRHNDKWGKDKGMTLYTYY